VRYATISFLQFFFPVPVKMNFVPTRLYFFFNLSHLLFFFFFSFLLRSGKHSYVIPPDSRSMRPPAPGAAQSVCAEGVPPRDTSRARTSFFPPSSRPVDRWLLLPRVFEVTPQRVSFSSFLGFFFFSDPPTFPCLRAFSLEVAHRSAFFRYLSHPLPLRGPIVLTTWRSGVSLPPPPRYLFLPVRTLSPKDPSSWFFATEIDSFGDWMT